ncbi:hypothetical protein ES705_38003 [subsurface metagenome]
MDNPARLLAILSELTIDELRLVLLFVEWLAAGMPSDQRDRSSL